MVAGSGLGGTMWIKASPFGNIRETRPIPALWKVVIPTIQPP